MDGDEWVSYVRRAAQSMIAGLNDLDLSTFAEELRRASTEKRIKGIYRELRRRGVIDDEVYNYIRKDAGVMRYYILAYIYDVARERLIF